MLWEVELEPMSEVEGGATYLDPDPLGPPRASLAAAVLASPIPCLLLPA